MDKKKHLSKKEKEEIFERLNEKADERDYKAREMILKISSSLMDDNNVTDVHGELEVGATEDPTNEDAWKRAKFNVRIFDTGDPREIIMAVIMNLYGIPETYGDAIFEDEFFDTMKGIVGEVADAEEEVIVN